MKASALITLSTVALILLLSPHRSNAVIVSVEPDDFPNFTELTNAVPGVTLRVATTSGNPTSTELNKVLALGDAHPPVTPSTGTRVFAAQLGALAATGGWFKSGLEFVTDVLRADFAVPTDFVSIDIIRSGSADMGVLEAFDAAGNLLETATAHLGAEGTFVRTSISRNAPDIAYILAAGAPEGGPPFNVVDLDNLRFNAVPEPTVIVLMGLGLAMSFVLGWWNRRHRVFVRGRSFSVRR